MSRLRPLAVVGLLGAACAIWSGVPLGRSGAPGLVCLAAACVCVAGGLLRLIRLGAGKAEPYYAPSAWRRLLTEADLGLLRAGWESGAVVAAAVGEALHSSRPWHTGILALLLISYLLAANQVATGQPADALRGQSRALALGVCAVAAITGLAMLPAAASAGALAAWLEIAAALAAVVAGALALPL